MKIGIDYSLSCPGLCINTSKEEFRYEDCRFYYLTNTKKYEGTFKENIAFGTSAVRYIGAPHKPYKDEPERYSNIADWFVDIVKSYYPPHQVSQTHPQINL